MKITILTVRDPAGEIRAYFTRIDDAIATYKATYSKVQPKPTWRIEEVEVLERSTHL